MKYIKSLGIPIVALLLVMTNNLSVNAQASVTAKDIYVPIIVSGSSENRGENLQIEAKPNGELSRSDSSTRVPHEILDYPAFSGLYGSEVQSAQIGGLTTHMLVYSDTIGTEDAAWLQIHFGDTNLGNESYVRLTALADHKMQTLDSESLANAFNRSAIFNGSSVMVELYMSPNEHGIYYNIERLTSGIAETTASLRAASQSNVFEVMPGLSSTPETICGLNDNRTRSFDPAVGRLMPVGCTAWLIANGTYLTAGHCVGAAMQTLQFNVPESESDGTINNPAPEDQYPVVQTGIVSSNGGKGDDWAVFRVNSSTNSNGERKLPPAAQGEFFRVSHDYVPALGITVIGYGVDGPEPCFGNRRQPGCSLTNPPRNRDNQTQQQREGISAGETVSGLSNSYWEYVVDSQPGNSGSPVIVDGIRERLTIGIHTHGDNNGTCDDGIGNAGTSFENDDLEAAINDFWGARFIYVDKEHPAPEETGTIMRPFDTLSEGITAADNNDTISIVEGSYSGPLTINKPVILRAPVGLVTLGSD